MGWRDLYRPASYRGAPFHVRESGTSHGRRQVVHEYPLRELPFVEDLGRATRRFQVEGYVLGEDYHLARDRLITACEARGPGELVHPYRGTLVVTCLGCLVRESSEEGNLAKLAMEFLEAGAATYPVAVAAPAKAAAAAADHAAAAAESALPLELPGPAAGSQVAAAAAASWDDVLAATLALRLRELDKLKALVAAAGDRVVERLALPFDFARDARIMIEGIAGTAAGQLEAVKAYLVLMGLAPRRVLGTSDQSRAAQRAADAVVELARRLAAAEAVRAAAAATYPSHEEALALRDELADALDLVAEHALDQSWAELAELRRRLVASVPPPGQDLPHVDHWTPPASLPSLVLAYQLYGDAARAEELAARNHVANPLFVPAGRPLEVLVDG